MPLNASRLKKNVTTKSDKKTHRMGGLMTSICSACYAAIVSLLGMRFLVLMGLAHRANRLTAGLHALKGVHHAP